MYISEYKHAYYRRQTAMKYMDQWTQSSCEKHNYQREGGKFYILLREGILINYFHAGDDIQMSFNQTMISPAEWDDTYFT